MFSCFGLASLDAHRINLYFIMCLSFSCRAIPPTVFSGPPQRRHGCGRMSTPESRSFQMRSLRCTGVWPSMARSARWLVAVAVKSRAWT